jgi:hypothetical protein
VIRSRRPAAWYLAAAIPALGVCLAGCAPRSLTLPTDPGTPLADFAAIHARVSEACTGVRTLTAALGLSGRAGGERLRGTVHAGFERPGSMRLEGVRPIGGPEFILVSRDGAATLFFPRANQVLRNAAPERILGRLTGVNLAPADLQAILTGCVVPTPKPTAGRVHGNGWASIDLQGEAATVFLRQQDGQWRVVAARRSGWQIEYPEWTGRFPAAVRLRSASSGADVDLRASLAQVEANVGFGDEAFRVNVPADAAPLVLEDLRAVGAAEEGSS